MTQSIDQSSALTAVATAAASLVQLVLAHTCPTRTNSTSRKVPICSIVLTQEGVEVADAALADMSAHQTLQWRIELERLKNDLHARMGHTRLLQVGLRHMRLDALIARDKKLLVQAFHSHQSVRERAFSLRSPDSLAKGLGHTQDLLGRCPIPQGPVHSYLVEGRPISAPTPQAAVALCLFGTGQHQWLEDLLATGQSSRPGRLRVAQVVCDNGLDLFAHTPVQATA